MMLNEFLDLYSVNTLVRIPLAEYLVLSVKADRAFNVLVDETRIISNGRDTWYTAMDAHAALKRWLSTLSDSTVGKNCSTFAPASIGPGITNSDLDNAEAFSGDKLAKGERSWVIRESQTNPTTKFTIGSVDYSYTLDSESWDVLSPWFSEIGREYTPLIVLIYSALRRTKIGRTVHRDLIRRENEQVRLG